MKLSLATSSVLLYATAVQSLPQASTTATTTRSRWFDFATETHHPAPVPQTTEPTKARTEYSVPVASPTFEDGIAAQPSGHIQAAKVAGDDPKEDKQKTRKDLEASRKAVTEKLQRAQNDQKKAEENLKTEQKKVDEGENKINKYKKAKEEPENKVKMLEEVLSRLRKLQVFAKKRLEVAQQESNAADDEIKELRKEVEEIDEAIKKIEG